MVRSTSESPPVPVSAALTPPPAPASAVIQCVHCGSPQFFGEHRTSTLGKALMLFGFVGMLVSIPLLFVIVGFVTLPVAVVFFFVGRAMKTYVNRCARCRKTF